MTTNDQYELMKLLIGYTIVGAFIFTVIVTCGSLIGIIKFADNKQQNKLFVALILEIVTLCLGLFTSALSLSPKQTAQEIKAPLEQEVLERTEQNADLTNKFESATLAGLRPEAASAALALVNAAAAKNIRLRIVSGYRNPADQAGLYQRGRTKPGPVITHARVTTHTIGLAFDVVPEIDGKLIWNTSPQEWQIIGDIGKNIGLVWGGDSQPFRDYPHFQTKNAENALREIKSRSTVGN